MNRRKKHKKKPESSSADRGFGSSLSWISAAVFILGLAVIAGLWLEKNSVISEVRFSGHFYTETEDLEASFSSPVGLHPDSVRFMALMDTVRTLPWIRESGVRVDAGGRMIVEVKERTPVALLTGRERRVYIDREGVLLPVVPGKAINVPLLHGFDVSAESGQLSGEEFGHVRNFLTAAKESELGWITISEVAYSREEGVIALTNENGVKLLFGYGDYEQKLDYWQAFYTEVIRKEGIENFTSIDIRYQDQIVTR